MLSGLNISNTSSIRHALLFANKEDLIPEGKPVPIGKALEACWARELKVAYLQLAKRFVKRVLLAFVLFVSSMFFFYGMATAAHQNVGDQQTASLEQSSTTDSGVSCDKSIGCRYLV